MKTRTYFWMNEAERAALNDLAARLGYTQRINGRDVPNRTLFLRAIANGELTVAPPFVFAPKSPKEESRG